MRFGHNRSHSVDFLFPVILLFVFALSAVSVILLAGNVYGQVTEDSALNYSARTSLGYIREKVHQNDEGGRIYIGEIGGCKALVLEQIDDNVIYSTYIYSYGDENGSNLYEIFAREGATIAPATGEKLLEVSEFDVEEISEGVFSISCTDSEGDSASTIISVKTTSN